ncbi:MAG TPA: glutathione transferase GstA [Xanthobacteraceae bacterium]|nr:glutathione transferase GstA [Xanthobacteraceae bacterium]
MKLYFAPGACSLSPHIVLREAALDFELMPVDLRAKKAKDGSDFTKINPKGQVPALETDDGDVLTEGPVIVQYVGDLAPGSRLMPPPGGRERYHAQEWLNFITSELHKNFSPLFRPTTPDAYKQMTREGLATRFRWLNDHLSGRPYLMGETFTAPDAYLYVMTRWTGRVEIDLDQWPALSAFSGRVAARPKVQEAIKAEGLLK